MISLIPISIASTLVVAIPLSNGLLVSADSRSTVAGEHIDGQTKLFVDVARRQVFTVTGNGDFIDNPPSGTSLRDWFPKAEKRFSAAALALEFWSKKPEPIINEADVKELAVHLLKETENYVSSKPPLVKMFLGKDIFRFVSFAYDTKATRSIIGNVLIGINAEGKFLASFGILAVSNDQVKPYEAFGESDYLLKTIINGPGQSYIAKDVVDELDRAGKRKVSETSETEGLKLAEGLIHATGLATVKFPPPSGIGGPLNTFLIPATGKVRELTPITK